MKGIPDLFEFTDGSPVKTEEDWRKRRLEMLELLSRHEYGFTPEKQGETTYKLISTDTKCASGHGVLDRLEITFPTQKGDFTFPVNYFHPTGNKKHLTFILINFRPEPYDMYFPAEEIIDNGFGIAQFYYGDITADANEFTSGIAPMFERRNDGTDWGKIGMWAFAASRVADILLSFPETERLAVIGHSRLGKTALWCGAQDERIDFVESFRYRVTYPASRPSVGRKNPRTERPIFLKKAFTRSIRRFPPFYGSGDMPLPYTSLVLPAWYASGQPHRRSRPRT